MSDIEPHTAYVAHILGGSSDADEYEPCCECGWKTKRLTAGAHPHSQWDAAWAIADAHVAGVRA